MWVRQCDLDARDEAPSPIPTRIASNEEFIPPPQSAAAEGSTRRASPSSAKAAARGQGLTAARLPAHRQRHGRGAAGPQRGLRRLLRGVAPTRSRTRRRSRRSGPRTSSSSTCRRTTSTSAGSGTTTRRDGRATSRVLPTAAARGQERRGSAGAAQPRPLRQGSLRRQRHGDGDHQRRAEPRLGQEPAAARPDGRHAQVRQRPGRLAARPVARPAAAQPRARRNSRRWSGRSRS